MLLFCVLLSIAFLSSANDNCPDWCGNPLDNITIWTDNPNVWRCELPSVSFQACSDIAFITCLRLDDLGGDLYLMLFPDSPTNIGIDPDYLARGRVDKLTTIIKCRDGKWTLYESSIRMTHLLCDQYIIDKKKAANSPYKPEDPIANISKTTLLATTMSDFEDDVETKNETTTRLMSAVVTSAMGTLDGKSNAETTNSSQSVQRLTTTEMMPDSNSIGDPKLPSRISGKGNTTLPSVTSMKTKQVLSMSTSRITTTPMTTVTSTALDTPFMGFFNDLHPGIPPQIDPYDGNGSQFSIANIPAPKLPPSSQSAKQLKEIKTTKRRASQKGRSIYRRDKLVRQSQSTSRRSRNRRSKRPRKQVSASRKTLRKTLGRATSI